MISVNINDMKYPEQTDNFRLGHIHFTAEMGDVIWLKGPNGCGKTTLLKLLSGVIPNLEPCQIKGEVLLDGMEISPDLAAMNISFCFQTPEHQFLFDTVRRQFFSDKTNADNVTLESLFTDLGVEYLLDKSIKDISSGERKLIAILATVYKNRRVFLFDEITSNLDDKHITNVLKMIQNLKDKKIIIIASHDPEVGKICNRIIYFDDLHNTWEISGYHHSLIKDNFSQNQYLPRLQYCSGKTNNTENILFECKQISYSYPDGSIGLNNISCTIKTGELVGLFGRNGSGKTTFTKMLVGNIVPNRGVILCNNINTYGILMQENEKQLFTFTVWDEITLGLNKKERGQEAELLLKRFGLLEYRDESPFFLSIGQKQKLLIGAILIHRPNLIILDEPFASLDSNTIENVVDALLDHHESYRPAVIFVDQDDVFCSHIVTQKIVMERNKIFTN